MRPMTAAEPVVPVLIVDDQAPFRRAARAVLAATPGFDAVARPRAASRPSTWSTPWNRRWC
jgi:hypothetical protein